MSWVTEKLKSQSKAAEVQEQVNQAQFKERQHMASVAPTLWDELAAEIQSRVDEFNAKRSPKVTVRKTNEQIEVTRENAQGFLACVQFDRAYRTITYDCPTQRPNAGNPPRGTYKIVLDDNKQPRLYGHDGQLVSIQAVAQEILEPALFGY